MRAHAKTANAVFAETDKGRGITMGDVLAVREEYRLKHWTQIIREQQSSGLTKRVFCEQHGITERQFYYWLKKVRQAVIETA